ncbi:hypothetical protein Y1Q_0021733 [Alligator mississippiensis]|uniref:Uncharacterized protein n=1 Tax=Alligator mississippiensis TaxID=8496 RepID=A0A151PBQ1_ALLMI|nr:hypothetical protein Y1Q_0021733 [Alligator mississippiensis]
MQQRMQEATQVQAAALFLKRHPASSRHRGAVGFLRVREEHKTITAQRWTLSQENSFLSKKCNVLKHPRI